MARVKKIRLQEGDELDFDAALTRGACNRCGQLLEWEASFDADGTNYDANCCGYNYTMFPRTVKIGVERDEP
jgi:hypothetical protein